jgi:hypothetical protein
MKALPRNLLQIVEQPGMERRTDVGRAMPSVDEASARVPSCMYLYFDTYSISFIQKIYPSRSEIGIQTLFYQ